MNYNLKKLKQKTELIPTEIEQNKIIKCPIFTFDLNEEINADEIVEICHYYKTDEYKERHKQAVYAWRSDYQSTSTGSMPKFQKLLDVVEKKINPIWKLPYTYKIDHFWFAIYNKGDSSQEHDHGIVDLACVYFAATPENSAPLVLPSINNEFSITPKTGMLVVFPGNCIHYVPRSTHQGERIIVAMNIMRDKIIKRN